MRRTKIWTALAALLLTAACMSTASKVTTSYYDVRGNTADELDRQIRSNGPMQGHAIAVAAVNFEPVQVLQEVGSDGCRFKTARFRVNAAITLPRWTDRLQSPDRDLRRAWKGLADYARAHEQTHVRIAEEFAKLLGDQLMAMPAERDCQRLDARAERVVERVARAHERAQRAFDAEEQQRLARLFAEAERRQQR